MEPHNKHYIRTNSQGYIIRGFSDALFQPQDGDICINDQGGYQFCLFPDGQSSPIFDDDGTHLYKWDGSQVVPATPEEREAEREAISTSIPAPTIEERTAALEAAMLDMLMGGVVDA